MKMKVMTLALLSALCMAGCTQQGKKNEEAAQSVTPNEEMAMNEDVPYTVAERYFVNNNLKALPPEKITSEDVFNQYFGMATVMDEKAAPTKIDFDRQYVIAVTLHETNKPTELTPVSLKREKKDGSLVFTYQEKEGEETTYTTIPSLLIIVSKEADGQVVLNPVYVQK